jgi:phasin family protein
MRDAGQQAEDTIRTPIDESDEMVESVTDTVSRTANAAVDITQRVADQGREAIWLGMRAAAGMNGRLAEVGYGRSHRFLEQAARVMDIYGQASDSTADSLRTLFNASLSFGRGVQQMQQTWLSLLDRSVNEATHQPQNLLRCRSLVELADTQREIYVDAVERAVESSTTMLQTAERVVREAMGPLQGRARSGARE